MIDPDHPVPPAPPWLADQHVRAASPSHEGSTHRARDDRRHSPPPLPRASFEPGYPQPAFDGEPHRTWALQTPAPPRPFVPATRPSLDEIARTRRRRRAPTTGWRRTVNRVTFGFVTPSPSPAERAHDRLVERITAPVISDVRIAVLSLKGGVGKTTTAVGLGATLASLRGDRIIAVDANPDLGTLAQRVPGRNTSTVRDLLTGPEIRGYADLRAHTSAASRLDVIGSDRDPSAAQAFSESDYRTVVDLLRRYYDVILTDCGTGLLHSAMAGVLGTADALVVVCSPAIDSARSAAATLDWLDHHGYERLAAEAVLVVNATGGGRNIDTVALTRHFASRCRAVHEIPFDPHLAEGAEIDMAALGRRTRRAFVGLAATVVDGFASTGTRG